MAFLSSLFSFGKPKTSGPAVVFGRYSDAYKSEAQQAAWNRSLLLFEEGRPLDAYRELLVFMRDEAENNVQWQEDEKGLHFEFRQGSRKITGQANRDRVKVESRIAWADDLNVAFMRRLSEHNFLLRYARFALTPDNCIAIVFDSSTKDGSPYKLLQAFRELAINADKQDDLLLEEFRSLRPVEEPLMDPALPESEKLAKAAYTKNEISTILQCLKESKPDPSRYPGGYVYLMLGTAFRLDYLVRPEGFMMDTLEKIYQTYFVKDDKQPAAKVESLKKLFQKLIDRSPEDLMQEMYRTRSTFGINPAVRHDRIQALIDGELPKMEWHLEQRHPEMVAMAIPKYIVGYALFHYTAPPPDNAFFHLLLRISEHVFFTNLGFANKLVGADGRLQKNGIEQEIRDITDEWRSRFPKMKLNTTGLDYSSLPLFARSYLTMVRNLEM
jgi:hypothetical protein